MSIEEGRETPFQREVSNIEVIAGLRYALDVQYRRFCQAARADWERLFGPKDPADACVSVRVAAIQTTAIRGSGFLKSRRPVSKSNPKSSVPHFAH
ncbi:MAG TPA: hypothetical protein VEP30_07645 [Chthoniobacterales bacterium]|nr:hypothetical protein [Chthoniobacterales bacterium]